ncbi:MAG: AI-2E family transporter [Woeseiaceae bacterium]
MTGSDTSGADPRFLANAMASFIRIGAVLLLLLWCFEIVRPFVGIVVWGMIIATALYPLHRSLTEKLNGREKTSAAILALIAISIIVLPGWLLGDSTVSALKYLAAELQSPAVEVPPPNESVASWPLIGERVYEIWSHAAMNLEETLNEFKPELQQLGQKALGMASGVVIGALQLIVATIIAGVLLTRAQVGHRVTLKIATKLAGTADGEKLANLSINTIRAVVKGVLGVAVIQAILSAIGFVAIGVPGAGLWAGAVLVVAIAQLPLFLVLGPIAVWVFSVSDPVPATIFLVYSLLIGFSDAFLKPILLGRGVATPVLVIMIGAIGGAISQGIVGLFLGAVVLVLGYELLTAWMEYEKPATVAKEVMAGE